MPKKPAYFARCPAALDPAAAPLPIQARDLLLEARSLNSREPAVENTPIRGNTKVELSSDFEGGNFEGEKLKEVILAISSTPNDTESESADLIHLKNLNEKRLRLARNLKELVRHDLVVCCYFFTTSDDEGGVASEDPTVWDLLLEGIQQSCHDEITKELIQVMVLVVSNVGLRSEMLVRMLSGRVATTCCKPCARNVLDRAGKYGRRIWWKQGYAIATSLWINNASTDIAFFLFSITETDQVDEVKERMVMDICICEHGFIFNVFVDSHKVYHEFRIQIPQKRWFKLAVNHKTSSFLSRSEVEIWIDNRRYSHAIPIPKQEGTQGQLIAVPYQHFLGVFRLYAGCPTLDTLNIPTTVRWSKSVLPVSFFKGLMGPFKFFPVCLSEAEVQGHFADRVAAA
eukprot:756732-Hanusia_phi.AAC.9